MSETQTVGKNPYDTDNMPEGGGLTRDIVVTSAKYVKYPMTYKDGSPVVDAKTKQPSFFVGLRVVGISNEREAKYEWSSGKKGAPSADGELLLNEKGEPAPIYQTSNLGKALLALEKGGFDKRTLYPRVSVLVGAKITLEGVDKVGADGKVKTHVYEGKTYNDIEWVPATYHGGAGTRAAAGGNGAAADLTKKAQDAVLAAVAQAGGSIERKDVFRSIAGILKGDAQAVQVSALVARQDFALPSGVVADGSTLKLAEA